MKIYTRTGDKGQTSLFGGKRVSKASLRVEAYGTVDEFNSAIGVAIAQTQNHSSKVKTELIKIQHDLFEIGTVLASPNTKYQIPNTKYLKERTEELENLIDQMSGKLPELRNFILPGGSKEGALLHLARSICRRAERRIIALSPKENIASEIIVYMNRLSDLLFTMARFFNKEKKVTETIWQGLQSR